MNGSSALGSLGQLKTRAQQSATGNVAEKLQETSKSLNKETESSSDSKSSFDKELKDAAEKVEGYMISFMVKQMRKTVKRTEGLFKRGQAEKIFQSRLDDKLANNMAKSKDFGIAEAVYNQFSADNTR
ncbi:MAG: rod-binding protein [bacterium]